MNFVFEQNVFVRNYGKSRNDNSVKNKVHIKPSLFADFSSLNLLIHIGKISQNNYFPEQH